MKNIYFTCNFFDSVTSLFHVGNNSTSSNNLFTIILAGASIIPLKNVSYNFKTENKENNISYLNLQLFLKFFLLA